MSYSRCPSMPVLTPVAASNASRADPFPVPLEPDIEHLRRNHGNTTTLCFTLIGQLQPASSSASISSFLSLLSHFNCSLSDLEDDENDQVTWWLQQLALGRDPVYYALPFVLIAGIVCDAVAVWFLVSLLLRTPTRCQGDVTSDVYLLWLAVTSDLWLLCAAVRALPDYVTCHVTELLRWTYGYLAAVSEWLSYAYLWLLITMSLNAAVHLNAGVNSSSDHLDEKDENSLNDTCHHRHHHHHHQHHHQRRRHRCRELFTCAAIHVVCVVSSLPQFFAYQLVDHVEPSSNTTSTVSRLDESLTASYEYAVVYHWYVVCLSVLLPVPLLIGLAGVLAASMLRKSRTRRERTPVKPRDSSVQGPRTCLPVLCTVTCVLCPGSKYLVLPVIFFSTKSSDILPSYSPSRPDQVSSVDKLSALHVNGA